ASMLWRRYQMAKEQDHSEYIEQSPITQLPRTTSDKEPTSSMTEPKTKLNPSDFMKAKLEPPPIPESKFTIVEDEESIRYRDEIERKIASGEIEVEDVPPSLTPRKKPVKGRG